MGDNLFFAGKVEEMFDYLIALVTFSGNVNVSHCLTKTAETAKGIEVGLRELVF